MTGKSFAELTKQIHLLNDLILSDMQRGTDNYAEESLKFSRRMYATKQWFIRISWANKRRYILALLEDLRSAWALSLLLKSLWNCRPKDAVLSASKPRVLSFHDETPMDHNRAALPLTILGQVMTTDRKWFHSLEPENQALFLSELLTIAGAPIMWEVLRRGQQIYERHRETQLREILECSVVVNESQPQETSRDGAGDATATAVAETQTIKKSGNKSRSSGLNIPQTDEPKPGVSLEEAQKALDASLAVWNTILTQIRAQQKLEELEMTFEDGTKRKIWKIDRPVPEDIETVDLIQLLPSHVAKKIFSYLPQNTLSDYAKVNKYWAHVIEELKAEWAAQIKLKADFVKLQEAMLRHDSSLDVLASPSVQVMVAGSTRESLSPSYRHGGPVSLRPSEKSTCGVSFRQIFVDKLKPAHKIKSKPIRRLSDLSTQLEIRGAADENTWQWCENVLRYGKGRYVKPKTDEGVFRFGDLNFPCPLMKHSLVLPLSKPLTRDPARPPAGAAKAKRAISHAPSLTIVTKDHTNMRYSLWSRNFSSLYKVLKVASYQYPDKVKVNP